MLPRRKLGTQGLEVSAIGLGLMSMSMSYGNAEEMTGLTSTKLGLNDKLFITTKVLERDAPAATTGRILPTMSFTIPALVLVTTAGLA